MENLRNKTQYIKNKNKNYLERFTKLNVYSYLVDKKINLGCKPQDVFSLFNGNTGTQKKTKDEVAVIQDDIKIDQSALQYYIILALQDFYFNYHIPLVEENKSLKDQIDKTKRKNDDRFETIKENLETLARHMSNIKK